MSTMTKRLLKTVDEVIDALGGPTAVGEKLDIGQNAVSMWKTRGIPPGWHLRIYLRIKHLRLGVSPEVFGLDSLEELQEPARRKRAAGQKNAAPAAAPR